MHAHARLLLHPMWCSSQVGSSVWNSACTVLRAPSAKVAADAADYVAKLAVQSCSMCFMSLPLSGIMRAVVRAPCIKTMAAAEDNRLHIVVFFFTSGPLFGILRATLCARLPEKCGNRF